MKYTLEDMFKITIKELHKIDCTFALAGGLAASFYRTQMRTTKDLDFLFMSHDKSLAEAEKILNSMGLEVGKAKLSDLSKAPGMNKKRSPVVIAVGRNKTEQDFGVDFILPDMPWFDCAIKNAQSNIITCYQLHIPVITPEDLIIAKAFAVKNATNRYKDYDDLLELFKYKHLGMEYLCGQLERLKLCFPKELEKEAPKEIRLVSKHIRNHL